MVPEIVDPGQQTSVHLFPDSNVISIAYSFRAVEFES